MANPKTVYVLLAYNEGESIGDLVEEVRRDAPAGEVVVVDDGSADETAAEARKRGATVLSLPVNLGIGAAFQTGLLYAIRARADRIVRLDGDGQHAPRHVRELLAALDHDGVDLALGSRFVTETVGFRSTFVRRLGIKILSGLIRLAAGQAVHDCTSGFMAMNSRALAYLAHYVPDDYPEPELLVMAIRGGLNVREVPVEMRARASGTSSLDAADSVFYMIKVALAILITATKAPRRRAHGN